MQADDQWDFHGELLWFANAQKSWAEAARILKISRNDLYRYKRGGVPHAGRKADLKKVILAARASCATPITPDSVSLSREKITLLRDMLLHLVHAIDLDLMRDGGDGGNIGGPAGPSHGILA